MEDETILDMYFMRLENAIEETRNKYGKRLFGTSWNILRNKEDAEECVNDALLKAWEIIPPNRPTMFGAFLAKIVRNMSINIYEAKNAKKRGGGETNIMLGELEDCIASSKFQPEKELEQAQVTEAINAFLEKTDKAARIAFVLRYYNGESIADIATRFKMSESKVKSILFRVRKKLRAHLEKEGILI